MPSLKQPGQWPIASPLLPRRPWTPSRSARCSPPTPPPPQPPQTRHPTSAPGRLRRWASPEGTGSSQSGLVSRQPSRSGGRYVFLPSPPRLAPTRGDSCLHGNPPFPFSLSLGSSNTISPCPPRSRCGNGFKLWLAHASHLTTKGCPYL